MMEDRIPDDPRVTEELDRVDALPRLVADQAESQARAARAAVSAALRTLLRVRVADSLAPPDAAALEILREALETPAPRPSVVEELRERAAREAIRALDPHLRRLTDDAAIMVRSALWAYLHADGDHAARLRAALRDLADQVEWRTVTEAERLEGLAAAVRAAAMAAAMDPVEARQSELRERSMVLDMGGEAEPVGAAERARRSLRPADGA